MKSKVALVGVALCVLTFPVSLRAQEKAKPPEFTTTFAVHKSELSSTGRNPFFILVPGYQLVYAGKEDGDEIGLTITVLDETKSIDGVETRIVEERETKNGKPVEVSRNYFVISKRTNDVYYFGEDVDIYKGGKVVSHEGAWLSGVTGAKFGLAIPGSPLLGARYYQEIAPGVAMDRAEVVSLAESLETPAGKFTEVLKILETTPLEPRAKESKYYAAGVGLIKDGPCRLVRHGSARN
jgi:hypothetical protein